MTRPSKRSPLQRSPARETRIANEIIVDAYNEGEQAMGWYYYLEDRLRFPFEARCVQERALSPLRRGERVAVIGMGPEGECEHDIFVRVRWEGRALAVPLAQLKPYRVVAETRQAVGDWHYWVAQGYVL